jgi:hypothetical protein
LLNPTVQVVFVAPATCDEPRKVTLETFDAEAGVTPRTPRPAATTTNAMPARPRRRGTPRRIAEVSLRSSNRGRRIIQTPFILGSKRVGVRDIKRSRLRRRVRGNRDPKWRERQIRESASGLLSQPRARERRRSVERHLPEGLAKFINAYARSVWWLNPPSFRQMRTNQRLLRYPDGNRMTGST